MSRSMLRFAEVIKMTDREVRRQRGAGCKRRTLKKKTRLRGARGSEESDRRRQSETEEKGQRRNNLAVLSDL